MRSMRQQQLQFETPVDGMEVASIVMGGPRGEVTVAAGDVFHFEPGHIGEVLEDLEMVEFTPIEEHRARTKHVSGNLARRGGYAPSRVDGEPGSTP